MRLGKHVEEKKDNWFLASKKKLSKAVEHKIKRIYVGILDALDKEVVAGNITKEVSSRMRSRVLNIANDQIRNVQLEMEKYNVEFRPYHIRFENPPEGSLKEAI